MWELIVSGWWVANITSVIVLSKQEKNSVIAGRIYGFIPTVIL